MPLITKEIPFYLSNISSLYLHGWQKCLVWSYVLRGMNGYYLESGMLRWGWRNVLLAFCGTGVSVGRYISVLAGWLGWLGGWTVQK